MDYRCALRLAYGPRVASFAILADDHPNWRPTEHEETLLGSGLKLTMQTVKLLDFANRIDELEASTNPFASVILAHLKTQATKHDPETRFVWKMRFIRNLYERGFGANQVRQLFRLIDWIMRLPAELDEKVDAEVEKFEKEKEMPFVTGIERRAQKRGEERGKEIGEKLGEERGMKLGEKLASRRHELLPLPHLAGLCDRAVCGLSPADELAFSPGAPVVGTSPHREQRPGTAGVEIVVAVRMNRPQIVRQARPAKLLPKERR
ncbi:MAG: hypothetical protein EXS16_22040 [Gemmataceae bacterium]|nr:hypothetical protein [Gemmataceae bacterium]